jgi:hypothetical protein
MVHHIHMYTHLDGNIKLEGRKIQSKMDYEIQNIWWSFKWDLVKGNGNCNFIMTTFSSNIFNKWVPYNFSLSFCFNREIAFSFVFYFLHGELVVGCSVYWVQILYCWLRTLSRRECKENARAHHWTHSHLWGMFTSCLNQCWSHTDFDKIVAKLVLLDHVPYQAGIASSHAVGDGRWNTPANGDQHWFELCHKITESWHKICLFSVKNLFN